MVTLAFLQNHVISLSSILIQSISCKVNQAFTDLIKLVIYAVIQSHGKGIIMNLQV